VQLGPFWPRPSVFVAVQPIHTTRRERMIGYDWCPGLTTSSHTSGRHNKTREIPNPTIAQLQWAAVWYYGAQPKPDALSQDHWRRAAGSSAVKTAARVDSCRLVWLRVTRTPASNKINQHGLH